MAVDKNPTMEELREILLEQEWVELKTYKVLLSEPDPDRSLLLTAHLIVENLLASIISTRLPHPEAWMATADFRSKLNLAKALCVIGPSVVPICTVLNKARNDMTHNLQPLSSKWRVELERLAFGRAKGQKEKKPHRIENTLLELISHVAGPWLKAKFDEKIHNLMHDHGERWHELLRAKVEERMFSGTYSQNDHQLQYEVALEITQELKQSATVQQKKGARHRPKKHT